MSASDLVKFAIGNLRRAPLRSLLTILGVAIGTAALVAMVSFGSGLQKTFSDEFSDLELFNTVRITPTRVDLSTIFTLSRRTVRNLQQPEERNQIILTDSVLQRVRDIVQSLAPNALVYPEIIFPCKVIVDTMETIVMAEALPAAIAKVAGYREIRIGKFFESDTASDVVISEILLTRIGIRNPQAAIGKLIKLTTIALDAQKLLTSPLPIFSAGLPIAERSYDFRIGGVLSSDIQKLSSGFRLILPIETSAKISRLNFLSTIELLRRNEQSAGYQAIIIRASNQKECEAIAAAMNAIGLNATSFTDQFEEFKKLFLLFDLALAVIGTVALVVATLGIANTMVMSVMERYREIGIMKAIGAGDDDIRKIFFVESAVIGFLGSVAGLVIGQLATEGINALVNWYVSSQTGTRIDFFYFPLWLVLSAIGFAVFISLVAGFYPARRAARIQPVEALRYQ
ncbi:MAG: FtsX-like permease family protein [Chloroherpetonaceae bacterium]|nr:ABC transporter permease [Chloroherpetonaceae bacterium]MDW8020598.1 FtsX-like permease family protein [Chloroherpetonaceae bacterium]